MREIIDAYFWGLGLWTPPILQPVVRDLYRQIRLTAGFPVR